MKKVAVVLAVLVLVVAFGTLAVAADMKMEKGTIKSIDAKKHTVVFCAEGGNKDVTLKAAKGVDLSKVKAGDKVEVSVEKGTLKHVVAAPAAPAAAPAAEAPKPAPKQSTGC